MSIAKYVRQGDTSAAPFETLRNVASRLRISGLTALPVVVRGRVVAVITERDLVKAMAICDRPGHALVADYMKDGTAILEVDEDDSAALARMLAIGCLDLPVVTDDHRLVGFVSAHDLLAVRIHQPAVAV